MKSYEVEVRTYSHSEYAGTRVISLQAHYYTLDARRVLTFHNKSKGSVRSFNADHWLDFIEIG